MARVLALIPDLLFGSQVQGLLAAAGHQVELVSDRHAAELALAGINEPPPAVFIVDMDADQFDAAEFVRERRICNALGATRVLAFYPHVRAELMQRAADADVDWCVPRSRLRREGAALVSELTEESA